jgi:hypothetical protein
MRASLSTDSTAFGGGPKAPAGNGAVTAVKTAIAAGNVAQQLRDAARKHPPAFPLHATNLVRRIASTQMVIILSDGIH